ncbi:hypothetical protein DV737_g941, partial [Chaetothyriales sp. CBS 132003]
MSSPIIYQNPASTVVLLDLPRSLGDAQALNFTVRSTAGIEQPWPNTEPKGARLERVLDSIDPDVLARDQRVQSEIDAALNEVKRVLHQDRLPWLCPRSTTGSADHVLAFYETRESMNVPYQLATKLGRVPDAPPLILSTTPGTDQFMSASQVQDVVVLNPSGQRNEINVNGETYLIPGSSRLLWSSILAGLPAIQGAASTLMKMTGIHLWLTDMADVVDVPDGNKAFVPLENNPEVMTSLVRELGLSSALQFHDVFSLTEPALLEFLPRPAVALLLVFPVTETYEKFRRAEDASKEEYSGSGEGEEVVWFKQTIRNACGLIGLLHSVTNGYAREQIVEGSGLDTLLKQAIPLKPDERADLLYNSKTLEAAHATAAARGDSTAPDARATIDLHFVAFVKDKNGNLWELDGRRKGPLNRGKLEPDEDVISTKGQELGVSAFLKREEAGGGELRFSVVMLGPSLD